jgi:hypothetical protein
MTLHTALLRAPRGTSLGHKPGCRFYKAVPAAGTAEVA